MSNRETKTVTVVTSIHPDFDKRVWRHAKGLAEVGYQVNLICPWNIDSGRVIDGVRFFTFNFRKNLLSRIIRTPLRILHSLKKLGADAGIVHFHDFDLLPWMAFLSFFKPVVYDVHENYPDEVRNRPWIPGPFQGLAYFCVKWGQWLFARLIRNIVLVTPHQESSFPGRGFNKIYVRNFASKKLLDSVSADYEVRDPIIVFLGAQHENNGSFLMLNIADICRNEKINCKFIAPDLFSRSEIKDKYIKELELKNLTHCVELFEPVAPQEIMRILNKARVAINPNLRVEQQIKGIHTKMYEFMAAGLPIIASDLPHQKELVSLSNCGYALPPERPEEFVMKIKLLLEDAVLAYKLGKNGSRYFAEYCTWEGELEVLVEFYQNKILHIG